MRSLTLLIAILGFYLLMLLVIAGTFGAFVRIVASFV